MSYVNKTLRIGPHWIPCECKTKGPTALDIISNQGDEITVLGMPGSLFPQFSMFVQCTQYQNIDRAEMDAKHRLSH